VPPVLYQLPLHPSPDGSLSTAKKIAELTGFGGRNAHAARFKPILTLIPHPFQNAPTAMDIAPEGSIAAVLSYNAVHLFHRVPGDDWVRTLQGKAVMVPIPRLRQAEAMCFGMERSQLYITSESLPAPLYRIDISRYIPQ
jgi:hypothetical protein